MNLDGMLWGHKTKGRSQCVPSSGHSYSTLATAKAFNRQRSSPAPILRLNSVGEVSGIENSMPIQSVTRKQMASSSTHQVHGHGPSHSVPTNSFKSVLSKSFSVPEVCSTPFSYCNGQRSSHHHRSLSSSFGPSHTESELFRTTSSCPTSSMSLQERVIPTIIKSLVIESMDSPSDMDLDLCRILSSDVGVQNSMTSDESPMSPNTHKSYWDTATSVCHFSKGTLGVCSRSESETSNLAKYNNSLENDEIQTNISYDASHSDEVYNSCRCTSSTAILDYTCMSSRNNLPALNNCNKCETSSDTQNVEQSCKDKVINSCMKRDHESSPNIPPNFIDSGSNSSSDSSLILISTPVKISTNENDFSQDSGCRSAQCNRPLSCSTSLGDDTFSTLDLDLSCDIQPVLKPKLEGFAAKVFLFSAQSDSNDDSEPDDDSSWTDDEDYYLQQKSNVQIASDRERSTSLSDSVCFEDGSSDENEDVLCAAKSLPISNDDLPKSTKPMDIHNCLAENDDVLTSKFSNDDSFDEIDMSDINSRWEKHYPVDCLRRQRCSLSGSEEQCCPAIKVRFAQDAVLTVVYTVGTEDRRGEWMSHAVDRERFQRVIDQTAEVLSPILDPTHRERVYQRLNLLE